jgi:hypothetical protein
MRSPPNARHFGLSEHPWRRAPLASGDQRSPDCAAGEEGSPRSFNPRALVEMTLRRRFRGHTRLDDAHVARLRQTIAALQNLQQIKAAAAAVDTALGEAEARAEKLCAELAENRSGPHQRSASAVTVTRDILPRLA